MAVCSTFLKDAIFLDPKCYYICLKSIIGVTLPHISIFARNCEKKNVFIPAKQKVVVGGVVKVLAAVGYVAVSYLQVV